jgi:hypothetical protein
MVKLRRRKKESAYCLHLLVREKSKSNTSSY